MAKVTVSTECFFCQKQSNFAFTAVDFSKYHNMVIYNRVKCPHCEYWFLALTPKGNLSASLSLFLDQRYFYEPGLIDNKQVAHVLQVLRDSLNTQRVRNFLGINSGVIRVFADHGKSVKIRLEEVASPEVGTFLANKILKVPTDKELGIRKES